MIIIVGVSVLPSRISTLTFWRNKLHNAKSKTYFSETRDVISRLSRQTLQTGILTSVLALAILFCFTQIHIGNMHTFL